MTVVKKPFSPRFLPIFFPIKKLVFQNITQRFWQDFAELFSDVDSDLSAKLPPNFCGQVNAQILSDWLLLSGWRSLPDGAFSGHLPDVRE